MQLKELDAWPWPLVGVASLVGTLTRVSSTLHACHVTRNWWTCNHINENYTKYCIHCHLLFEIAQCYIYSVYLIFYQRMSNWVFGYYRTLTILLGQQFTISTLMIPISVCCYLGITYGYNYLTKMEYFTNQSQINMLCYNVLTTLLNFGSWDVSAWGRWYCIA